MYRICSKTLPPSPRRWLRPQVVIPSCIEAQCLLLYGMAVNINHMASLVCPWPTSVDRWSRMLLAVSGPVWILRYYFHDSYTDWEAALLFSALRRNTGAVSYPHGPMHRCVSQLQSVQTWPWPPSPVHLSWNEYLSTTDATKQHSAQVNCFIYLNSNSIFIV